MRVKVVFSNRFDQKVKLLVRGVLVALNVQSHKVIFQEIN